MNHIFKVTHRFYIKNMPTFCGKIVDNRSLIEAKLTIGDLVTIENAAESNVNFNDYPDGQAVISGVHYLDSTARKDFIILVLKPLIKAILATL